MAFKRSNAGIGNSGFRKRMRANASSISCMLWPFDVRLDVSSKGTLEAMLEAERIAKDPQAKALGVEDALEELKKNGVNIAVFSNKQHISAISVVETIFGKGFFDYIQGQTDRISIKPDPTGVLEILDRFGASKEECLYFGDTNTDMMTGRNAGVTTVGVTWGFRPRSELEQYGADIIIDSAEEIPELVKRRA